MARNLRIGICAYKGPASPGYDLERNLSEAVELIHRVAAEGADLAVLPETFAVQNAPDWMNEGELLDGCVVSALAGEARRLGIGIAAGHPTIEDGVKYNSLVLLDRRGDIAALYHKTFPTIKELESGIVPGDGPRVVDTEFGRLGFAICYDLNFAELRVGYRDLKPDLILFCSAFRGGLQAMWWAYETRSYMVTSCIDPKSMVVNPLGRVVAETDDWTRTVTRTIKLDCAVVHYDYTNLTLADGLAKYGAEFEFEWSEPEGVMLITSTGEMSTGALLEKMNWEQIEDYFARARRTRDRAVAGEGIEIGPPPW